MVSSSLFKEEDVTMMLPDDDVMLERRGFQTRGFRRELGPDVLPINSVGGGDVRKIEGGDSTYVDPESDFALGPTGLGETGGSVGLVKERGVEFDLYRYAHSLAINEEDREVNADQMSEKVRAIMEMFDLQMDYTVFNGVDDENGNTLREDIFTKFKNGIPADRTIDCSTLSLSSDLNGEVANLFREHLYSLVEGHYFQDSWATLIAKHPVHAKFNRLDTHDGAGVFTEYEFVDGARVPNKPGIVNRRVRVPSYLGLAEPGQNAGELSFDITSLGTDEALLLPPTNGDFAQMWEQGTPDHRGPLPKEGWREVHEYKMWGAHAFDDDFSAGNDRPIDDSGDPYPDSFHITNVSSLF